MIVRSNKADYSGACSEEEFPELYALAREAAEEMDVDGKIHIFTYFNMRSDGCNASVNAEGGHICLYISVLLLGVLNRLEMKQILLHEFSHVEGVHHKQDKGFHKLMYFLEGEGDDSISVFTGLGLRLPSVMMALEGAFYMVFSSKFKEAQADSMAQTYGDTSAQASALSKSLAYRLYFYMLDPYINHYRSEDVPQHFASEWIDNYRKSLREDEARWRAMLERELPSRRDSHPTFRQRWDALGNCPYSLEPSGTGSNYEKECRKAIELVDKRHAELGEDYQKAREEYYCRPLETVTAYELAPESYTTETLRPVIDAYYALGMPDKALAVCDHILSSYDSPFATAYASFRKGGILLSRFDPAGIDFIYQALEHNNNYVESGLDEIASFCCMMGLEDRLEEYRARAAAYYQRKKDQESGGIDNRAKLVSETLPDGWQERILDYALNVAKDSLSHVYLVREIISEDFGRSAFILRFKEGTEDSAMEETMDKVFVLLDDWPDGWEFSLYMFEKSMEKPLNRVDNSCIYSAEK